MSVELLNILKYDSKVGTHKKNTEGHWLKRKEAFRAKRNNQSRGLHKIRRRQIDTATTGTEQPDPEGSTRRVQPSNPSRISAEWIGATGGPPAEVILRLHPAAGSPRANISLADIDGSGVVVRAEEALIVTFVLLLWVAAIALFFNRWGKIRCVYKLMLEPYQPKFQQQHRQSCVLENSISAAPPLNSVFVGSMGGMALIPESPPRRSRSVADLPALNPQDNAHSTSRSSRATSLHSAADLRVCVPSPRTSRAASLHSTMDIPQGFVQVHVRGSINNINRPKSPRRLTITNV